MSDLQIILRRETPEDFREVEIVTREAFWNQHVPGCNEHYLAHVLRNSPAFIGELDYVALIEDKIVGNIMYATSILCDADQNEHTVLTFGPVSVLPEYQGRGIGTKLITHTIELARKQWHKIIVIYGDPEYYCRFGFIQGEQFGLRTKDGYFSPALQILELTEDAMKNISGRFIEDDVYDINESDAEQFDANFPSKHKLITPSQSRFQELLSQSHI